MSQTSICNLALLRIGIAQSIASISEQSASARACNAVYDQCLRTMLRERPWPFAVRQEELVVVSEDSLSNWQYSYRYPTNYINIHNVVPAVDTTDATVIYTDTVAPSVRYPFAIGSDSQGRLIHSNLDGAVAIGTKLITDTTQFDPMFTSALAWFIASEIAFALTKNKDIGLDARNEYERIVSDAVATAHNEVKPEITHDSSFSEARL